MGTFGNAQIGANSDITSMTGLSDDGIPHAKIANLQGNKNAIINGDFNIWQRGTSFAAISHNTYNVDRFIYNNITAAVQTLSRDTDVPTQSESGHKSNYSLKLDCTTEDTSVAVSDFIDIAHRMEGYNFAPFVGKTATLSFWVKAVKEGIYCVAFKSSNSDRSYIAEYTISSASTWEKKTITLTFDYTGGTWDYTTGIGLHIIWTIMTGTNYHGAADTWLSANNSVTSNQVNGVDSTDNNFWLAQVQFELGSVATDFEYRNIGTELARCQRYYEKSFDQGTAPAQNTTIYNGILQWVQVVAASTGQAGPTIHYKVAKRAVPTLVTYSPTAATAEPNDASVGSFCSAFTVVGQGENSVIFTYTTAGGSSVGDRNSVHWSASAEL